MNIKDKLKTLPNKPGCYLMKDKNNTIIYVGKAVNLKNRVNSYFIGAHDYKTTKLVSNIVDFDYIVVGSEKEALILEYNLIKQYDPKFNIVFKDDKSYPYILLSDSNEPHVSVVRITKKNKYKGKLFGPYPDVTAARNTIKLIENIFPTRKCKNKQKDLCLYYHIGKCLGYCQKNIEEIINEDLKDKISSFLNGDIQDIINDLKNKMNEASSNLDFEKANEYKNLIYDLNQSILKQNVQRNNTETFDIFNYEVEDGYICITGLFISKGRLLNSHKYLDYLVGDPENFVSSYIYQFYEINLKPKTLYLPKELVNYFKDIDYKVETVTKGQKYQLLKDAKQNSIEYLRQNKEVITRKDQYYEGLSLEFKKIFNRNIKRIELFDNSHTSGTNTVAAMVVFENFKANKKEYRLYKLDEGADDLKSMYEVLYRRYLRVLKDNLTKPDLIIVDGAKTQIEIAKKVLSSLNLDIIIVGLGKDNHHNTNYLMNSSFEKINIDPNSNVFFFLSNAQDEVHRFAITYHKKLRQKAQYASILDDVKGLGPKSRVKLLRKYKTISNIKELSLEELETVLNKKTAQTLYNKLENAKKS